MAGKPLVAIGKIVGAHGIRGELKILLYIEDFGCVLELGSMLLAGPAQGEPTAHSIELARFHKGTVLTKLEGVTTRNDAEALVGREVFIPEQAQPELPAGSFKLKTLIGLVLIDAGGLARGKVRDVDLAGKRATLDVDLGAGGNVLVPFVAEYVKRVDLAAGSLFVTEAFEGLLTPEEVAP